MMSPMTLQVGGHHAHHGAHPYREAYLRRDLRTQLKLTRRSHLCSAITLSYRHHFPFSHLGFF